MYFECYQQIFYLTSLYIEYDYFYNKFANFTNMDNEKKYDSDIWKKNMLTTMKKMTGIKITKNKKRSIGHIAHLRNITYQ